MQWPDVRFECETGSLVFTHTISALSDVDKQKSANRIDGEREETHWLHASALARKVFIDTFDKRQLSTAFKKKSVSTSSDIIFCSVYLFSDVLYAHTEFSRSSRVHCKTKRETQN